MTTKLKTSVAAIGFLALLHAFAGLGDAYADEVSAENLRLENTVIKSATGGSALSGTPAAGFTPTTVQCPERGTCTIRIEVSAQFANIQSPNVAAALVTVDASQAGVQPFGTAGLDSTSTTGASNARTFCWMKTGLTRGEHTIGVSFFTNAGGFASLVGHTLTIQVFSSFPGHGQGHEDGQR